MSKNKQHKGKGAPAAPFNAIQGLDAIETVTAEVVSDAVETANLPKVPGTTDTYRQLVRGALAELVKANSLDIYKGTNLSEDEWVTWAEETVPEVTNVKVLSIRMEGKLIGELARKRAMRADQRGGDQSKNKAEPKTAAEKMQDTKLKTIAENGDLYAAYCEKQATMSKPVSIAGAVNAIRMAKDKAAGKVSTTESTFARRERLTEDALAELADRETSFKTVGEVVSFAKERLTMVLIARDTVSNEEIANAIVRSLGARKVRGERAEEAEMAAKLAANQQANAAKKSKAA